MDRRVPAKNYSGAASPVRPMEATSPPSEVPSPELHEKSPALSLPQTQQGKDSYSIVDFQKNSSLEHLSASERNILESELLLPSVKVSYFTLFRYATKNDLLVITISIICAAISGAVNPLMTVVFGQFAGTFQKFFLGSLDDAYFLHNLNRLATYFVYLAVGQFAAVYISVVGFMYAGERTTQRLREEYLAAVLRQNIAFFDKWGAGDITSTITANMDLVQVGISEKVALCISALATFVAALVVGFVKNWRLSCILLSIVATVVVVMGVCSVFIIKYSKLSLGAYSVGSAIADESISSIRITTAFNCQSKLANKYERSLMNTMHWGFRLKISVGCMVASMICITYLEYSLSFWEGSRLLVAGYSTLPNTLTVILAMLLAAVSVAHAAPHVRAFGEAIAAADNVFKLIDRPLPGAKILNTSIPDHIQGALEFRHVKHIFPSRPEVTVLDDFNLAIPTGKVTALVGTSGSGKSTIVNLIEKFYKPVDGQVLLDSQDIQTLDTKWLRHQMSLVSQEPVLFNCSIQRNIEHGLIGTDLEYTSQEKRAELVVQAARVANAHEFIISRLPNGYETLAGDRGVLLSGGQKQRIAIARAVIRNPKILLLDEVTSSLDSGSEAVVQAALDQAAQGRTTIMIAHRLSTIKRADNIVVLSKGRIVEQGTHEELLSRNGVYFNLAEAQRLTSERESAGLDEEHNDVISSDTKEAVGGDWTKNLSPGDASTSAMTLHGQHDGPSDSLWKIIKFISAFNRQETGIMGLGLFCSILAGGGMPVQGVIFAKCVVSLSLSPAQYSQLRTDVNYWSLMFLAVACGIWTVTTGQGVAFAYCSERLIYRARGLSFRTILRQEISYFDYDIHSVGALSSSLSKGANDLAGISGATLGAMLNLIATITTAIILSCIIGWKLALVCASTIPILLLCGFLRFWVLSRFEARAGKAYLNSATIACEAVSAVSTIASLTREEDVWNSYHGRLKEQLSKSIRSILKTSLLYAAAQSFALLCMGLGFWYGGRLILAREYSMFQFFVCFSSVIFSAQSAGALFSFAPDMAKSRQAAQQLKYLCDRVPAIDSWAQGGDKIQNIEGKIEFRNVYFSYPSSGVQVLQGLNICVQPGQLIALVGASGCGKSTAIGLIERFYSPTSGGIFFDGKNIMELNVKEYRSHLALVSQDSVLYSGTVRENVLLGVEAGNVEDEKVVEACQKAGIYDFIMSLPNGMNTLVGSKGTMLSGGQKQMVALARAIIRNPKILLLDEATSALDSESEKAVQTALDAATRDRTTIAVAHRLSTIQNADYIYVFDQGRVVESGTHHELMKRTAGRYAEMARLQRLTV